ncbi:chorismate mutase [Streptococcus loxodontisalivarius]|uniref:Chorismate mutase n=1 Tax=Streptococcus loxodontisalivarius TaxID=1349415 RepID=A0ABS2PQ64_9STRE|nr:chorismate mutase [Streptococcus loxodontisalivarius]MBM7642179.1 chorismate mutase [Streptococcus loxodontisalivarius]
MDLNLIRNDIDAIDRQMVELLEKRMHLVTDVAEFKRQTGKAVFDAAREEALLEKVTQLVVDPDFKEPIKDTYEDILKHSRAFQTKKLGL